MPGLDDPDIRGTSAHDSEDLGSPLQPGTSSQCAGTWRTGSSGRTWVGPEVRIPTSIGGRCARARKIGARRLASRVFARSGTGGYVVGDSETGGRMWSATFLRSTERRTSVVPNRGLPAKQPANSVGRELRSRIDT